MSDQRVVVIGASAGGIDALKQIVRRLPSDFAAPLFVVVHIPSHSASMLAHILSREGTVEAKQAEDGERFRPGVLYVAAPDKHLLVEKDGTVRSTRGPRENRHRPAVDPLFRSAAFAFGSGVIGVILSGTMDDGTAGLVAVKRQGGIAIVQDPADALYPGMPSSALMHVEADYKLPASAIAGQLADLLLQPVRHAEDRANAGRLETEIVSVEGEVVTEEEHPGHPSPYSCPDCGGVLWQIDDGDLVRYRCRVGHAYSVEAMVGAQDDQIEEALWMAVKTLEENARLSERLGATERGRGHEWMAKRFEEREQEARRRVDVIRRFLTRDLTDVPEEEQRS